MQFYVDSGRMANFSTLVYTNNFGNTLFLFRTIYFNFVQINGNSTNIYLLHQAYSIGLFLSDRLHRPTQFVRLIELELFEQHRRAEHLQFARFPRLVLT